MVQNKKPRYKEAGSEIFNLTSHTFHLKALQYQMYRFNVYILMYYV